MERSICFLHEKNYYALITSRVNYGPVDERGVIGLAKSKDLLKWKVLPPISNPGDFGQLEVPQMINLNGKNIIIFNTSIETTAKSRKSKLKDEEIQTGIFYLKSDQMLPISNYSLDKNYIIFGDKNGSLYSGKIIVHENETNLLAFHNYNKDGEFLGYLSDPILLNLKI